MEGLISEFGIGGMLLVMLYDQIKRGLKQRKENGYSPIATGRKVEETALAVHDIELGIKDLILKHKDTDNREVAERVEKIFYTTESLPPTIKKLYTSVDMLNLTIQANSDLMKEVVKEFKDADQKKSSTT